MLESQSQSAPVSKALTRGFQTYDDLKEKVVQADTSMRDVGSQIARKVPELRFNI
jgi:NAD-dependent DNA ligase